MGRQIKGLLYFYYADMRYSLIVFWTILAAITAITLTIGYFLKDVEEGFVTLSLTGPMYVYCAILGFLAVKEFIPFSLKRGATRKNIYISLALFFFSLSLVKALVANTVQLVLDFIIPKVGIDNFAFLHLAYFTHDTWINRIFIDTTIMFFFFAVMFIVSLLFYRYGLAIGGAFIGLVGIIVLTGFAQGWLTRFFFNLFETFDDFFYVELLAVGIVAYALSILFLKKITILKAK